MAISRNIDNGIIYPIGVYQQYNLYLIEEYNIVIEEILNINDGLSKKSAIQTADSFLNLLIDLLENNTSNNITNILNVLNWEEELNYYYETLRETYKHNRIKNKRHIKSIESFLRKEKLRKINEKKM